MSEFYRKRTQPYGSGAQPVTSVRFSKEVTEGLAEIRRVFTLKYPTEKFPTLSAILEQALSKYLDEFAANPRVLREEVAEFKARYDQV